jgi:hypothetical protein
MGNSGGNIWEMMKRMTLLLVSKGVEDLMKIFNFSVMKH